MNELARSVLVSASLEGIEQVQRELHTHSNRHCALGVLHYYAHGKNLTDAKHCRIINCQAMNVYQISNEEWNKIIEANDELGWDFLTIARKLGSPEISTGEDHNE